MLNKYRIHYGSKESGAWLVNLLRMIYTYRLCNGVFERGPLSSLWLIDSLLNAIRVMESMYIIS